MKNRRLILSALLVLALVLFPASASAASAVNEEHSNKVINENKTYEGFMASDDMLSFDEIASMPDASISCEAVGLAAQSDEQLQSLGFNDNEIRELRTEAAQWNIEQIQEKDRTYEGFLANDDVLSFDELLLLPNTSVVNEMEILNNLKSSSDADLSAMGMSAQDIRFLKNTSLRTLVLKNASTFSREALAKKRPVTGGH